LLKSEEFQKHFQRLQDVSSSENYGNLDEKGNRLAESCSQSLEQMHSSQHTFQIAQSELNQVSENATWVEQNSHLVRRSLNQDFVNWASEQYANEGGFAKAQEILHKGDSTPLISGFVDHIKQQTPQLQSPNNYVDPQVAFTRDLPNTMNIENAQESLQQHLSKHTSQFSIPQKKTELMHKFSQAEEMHDRQFDQVSSKIESGRAETIQHFHSESDRSLYTRPFDLASAEVITHINKLAPFLAKQNISLPKIQKNIASGFQIKEEPFWMKPEETR